MRLYLADTSTSFDVALAEKGMPMKTYLADTSEGLNQSAPHSGLAGVSAVSRILISYHYFKKTNLDTLFAKYFSKPYPEVFLDSGAFSAFTQGETIDIQAYCDYIKQYQHLFRLYSNLDVIGSVEGTFANQQKMERAGLKPLPVFHTGEDWKYLTLYLADYPYIALGGMVPYLAPARRKTLMVWLLRCFKMAQGKSVFHGFGCTVWEVVKALPWYSVDSSSWGTGFRYGRITLFDDRVGKFVHASLGNHKECYQYAAIFRSHGFDPGDFADRTKNTREKNCAIAAIAYRLAERWLERRHGIIEIPEREKAS